MAAAALALFGRLRAVFAIAVFVTACCSMVKVSEASRGSGAFVIGGHDFSPLENGLLRFSPGPAGPAMAPDSRFPLVLAAKRTRRPDVLDKLRIYTGGWSITNKHYWSSVGFTGAGGFILAILWFVSFGIALALHQCYRWEIGNTGKGPSWKYRACLVLLVASTCAASTGCILLSVGQDDFHDEVLDTLGFVVNQSDFTVQILKNVTDFLTYAKAVNIAEVYLPANVQHQIDKVNVDLISAADTLSEKTYENSGKVRRVIDHVRSALIVVAAVMLVLAVLGFLLSVLEHKHAIYIFILSGWLLVAVTFALCGGFVILNNAVGDTCTAMDQWVQYPEAETALSDILPCVNEQTTNQTLYQSKEVILQLVNVVNTAIWSIVNSDSNSSYYNQSGPTVPPLCSPYDSQIHIRQCQPYEVSFENASMVWQNYICAVSDSGLCSSPGRITPDIYTELVTAVNVSYALDHYAPLLLSLQDCNFVRETFNSITKSYCPDLEHGLKMVNTGLALISSGVMLCLIFWIVYANRHQREEVFVTTPSKVKVPAKS